MPEQVKDNLDFITFNGLDFAKKFLEISLSSLLCTVLKIKLEKMGYFFIKYQLFYCCGGFLYKKWKKSILA